MARPKRIGMMVTEAIIRTSGWATSLIVLLIVLFLFKEGLGLFASKPLEEGLVLAVHPDNPVGQLSAAEVRLLHEKGVSQWADLNHAEVKEFREPVFLLNLSNLEKLVKEEELGERFEKVPQIAAGLMQQHKGIVMALPRELLPPGARQVELANIGLGQFLFGTQWYPTAAPSPEFGALPLILGTLWVTLGAILVALPVALAVSIYMSELASPRIKGLLKPTIELLAGIPSVVYGFFGLVVVVPLVQATFGLDTGETALTGSILLAIIALPTIITVSEDALGAVPRALKEASLALGSTHWQTIVRVSVPYAISGISAAVILGVGRAVGETMTVLMVTGNSAVLPSSFFERVRTLSATIAAELGEAPQGGLHYRALFMVGIVLFFITFAFNMLASYISAKNRVER